MALAAHPGWTRSNLAGNGAALGDSRVRRQARPGRRGGPRAVGRGRCAAGPVRRDVAATSHNGQYIGPAALFGMFGPPRVDRPSRRARDAEAAARLWEASEELTGVRYSVGAGV